MKPVKKQVDELVRDYAHVQVQVWGRVRVQVWRHMQALVWNQINPFCLAIEEQLREETRETS